MTRRHQRRLFALRRLRTPRFRVSAVRDRSRDRR